MSARSKARKRALDVLYAAEARGVDPIDVMSDRIEAPEEYVLGEYAEVLIRGVSGHLRRIDDLLSQHIEGWTLERLPAVDRAILRIAIFEMVYSTDVPPAVVIDEAVEAAKTLSTDNSPKFVNGVLGQIQAISSRLR